MRKEVGRRGWIWDWLLIYILPSPLTSPGLTQGQKASVPQNQDIPALLPLIWVQSKPLSYQWSFACCQGKTDWNAHVSGLRQTSKIRESNFSSLIKKLHEITQGSPSAASIVVSNTTYSLHNFCALRRPWRSCLATHHSNSCGTH